MGNENRAEKRTIEETAKYLKDLAEAFESQADEELKLNGDTGRYELLLGKSDAYGLAAFELERNMESAAEAHRRLTRADSMIDIDRRADDLGCKMSEEEIEQAEEWLSSFSDTDLSLNENLDLAIESVKGSGWEHSDE